MMRNARPPWRSAAVAALSIAIALRGEPRHFRLASAFAPCGRRSLSFSRPTTCLQSSTAHVVPETPTRQIEVQESRANQQLDESSTVVHAARLAEGGCEGYLIQKPDNAFEAHISCSAASVDQFAAVYHKLLLPYLAIEHELYEEERDGKRDEGTSTLKVLVDGELEGRLAKELERIGFADQSSSESNIDGLGIDLAKYIPFLNEFAFRHRGTDQGITALHALKMLSERRVPFDFNRHRHTNSNEKTTTGQPQRRRNVASRQKQVLPSNKIDAVMEIVDTIKARKWLSDNPDSVDGLPSLHLNLITDGKPLFERSGDDDDDASEVTFSRCIVRMVDILRPYLYDDLLPEVRKLTNSSTVEISDVFIRNYGKVDPAGSTARYGLSAHYDVTAFATSVVTLDSTAALGRQGLYTIPPSPEVGASGHASLRKFFPLEKGDGVVHTYDVLHGVDVDPKLNRARTSLIVWFTNGMVDEEDKTVSQPWLLDPTDDIGEFVLGLASESAAEEDGSHMLLKNAIDSYGMYLKSALHGNIFAMTALAQMCDDGRVPDSEYEKVYNVLAERDEYNNPFLPRAAETVEDTRSCKELAKALRYRASIQGGHRVAQVALADDIMGQYMAQRDGMSSAEQVNMLLMASTLFSMALAQGNDSQESLERLMDVECSRLSGMGVEVPSEEFFASPVVQNLLAFR